MHTLDEDHARNLALRDAFDREIAEQPRTADDVAFRGTRTACQLAQLNDRLTAIENSRRTARTTTACTPSSTAERNTSMRFPEKVRSAIIAVVDGEHSSIAAAKIALKSAVDVWADDVAAFGGFGVSLTATERTAVASLTVDERKALECLGADPETVRGYLQHRREKGIATTTASATDTQRDVDLVKHLIGGGQ